MPITENKLRELAQAEEGQYHDRKSLFEGPPGRKQPRNRREVRDQIAEQVAGFANAEGGVLILGVEDDGTLTGHAYPADAVEDMLRVPEIRLVPPQVRGYAVTLDGHELLVFEVAQAVRAVMVDGDGYPYRMGDVTRQFSEEKINAIKDHGLIESAEARPARRVELAALDRSIIGNASIAAGTPDLSTVDYLVGRRLADRQGTDVVLRQAAVLLFAREPHTIEHPNAGVRVFRVAGTERLTGAKHNVQEFPRFEGNLPGILERVRVLLDTLIQKSAQLRDLFFEERPEYPTFAWQEALVNAVAHRDYAIEGRCVEVWLYSDRLEIQSPGPPLAEVALADLQGGKTTHATRNPRIARALAELGVMRNQGEGIPRMFEEMEASYLPLPEIDVHQGWFRVVLRNEPIFKTDDADWSRTVRAMPVTVTQKRGLVALRDRDFANADYGELNALDRDASYRELHDLVERGLLSTSGSGAGTRYRVQRPIAAAVPASSGPFDRLVATMSVRGYLTNADVRDALGVPRKAAQAQLGRWVRDSVLVREGEGRWTRYRAAEGWPPRAG